jgi:hypothetical protein
MNFSSGRVVLGQVRHEHPVIRFYSGCNTVAGKEQGRGRLGKPDQSEFFLIQRLNLTLSI